MKKKTVMAMLIMSMMLPGTTASAEQPGDLICVQSGEVSGITESAGEESADEYFILGEESGSGTELISESVQGDSAVSGGEEILDAAGTDGEEGSSAPAKSGEKESEEPAGSAADEPAVTVELIEAVEILDETENGQETADGIVIDAEHFPDEAFRNYIGRIDFDKDQNGILSPEETDQIKEIKIDSESGIGNLKGIEYFTELTSLDCSSCELASLDISHNTALEVLNCSGSRLTGLDITQNPFLEKLFCGNNQLAILNVSGNPALKLLSCSNNQLLSLDVSSNSALEELFCNNNHLVILNVSQNPELKTLSCYNNQLGSLDVSQNPALEKLSCGNNQLTVLNVSQNPALQVLSCEENQLTALDVDKNPVLKKLSCENNRLTGLNVSSNPVLQILTCDKNQLTSLNINNTAELYYLSCSGNQLKALDVSQSPALQILFCGDNQLTSLDAGQNPNLNILSGTSSLHIAAPVNDSGVWQMNLADLIGKSNLRRVTLATGGTSLSKGIVTFTGDEAPQALEYRYNTRGPALSGGSRLLHVRLTWDVPAKEPETPGGDETTPGKKQQTITVNQIIMRAYKKNEIFSLGAKAKGKLTYKISNTKVAIVSAAGKVKTVGYGEAVIAINAAATEEYEAAAVKVRLIIGPGAVKFSSVTSPKKGSLQFRWTYNSQVSGYELNCSADKNFMSIKKGTAKGSKNLAGSISGLKSGGIYYVRIRGYRLVSGKKIYGPWSAVKYCKVR